MNSWILLRLLGLYVLSVRTNPGKFNSLIVHMRTNRGSTVYWPGWHIEFETLLILWGKFKCSQFTMSPFKVKFSKCPLIELRQNILSMSARNCFFFVIKAPHDAFLKCILDLLHFQSIPIKLHSDFWTKSVTKSLKHKIALWSDFAFLESEDQSSVSKET